MPNLYSGGKLPISLAAGAVVTAVLLLIMQQSIRSRAVTIGTPAPGTYLTWLRVPEPMQLEARTRRPEPPQKVERAPLPSLKPLIESGGHGAGQVANSPLERGPVEIRRISRFSEGELLPIMTVPPEYPQRLANRAVEGWVVVEFSVDTLGRVQDPTVIESQPARVFDSAALKAVKRYKYKPRVVNGEPMVVRGVRQRIVFDLS